MTKDKGYVAAGKILAQVKKLKGKNQYAYLDQYFTKVWDDHDQNHNNYLLQSDVKAFYDDILAAGDPLKPDQEQ